MKFKMASAAILNLLFLSILVKRSFSGGSRLHCCKISFIYDNRRPSYCCLCKNQDGGRRHLRFYFCSIFWHSRRLCRTSNVIHVPNFVQICAIVNELWAINKIQNGGRRHLEFIIFVYFWSNGLFPVAAFYIAAKLHSSTSIGGWVTAVCAKIKNGGRRHLVFCFCLMIWHSCM